MVHNQSDLLEINQAEIEESTYQKDYLFYGCGYKKNEEIEYFFTDNDIEIWDFIEDALRQGIVISPVHKMTEEVTVGLENQGNLVDQAKERLVNKIARIYNKAYFAILEKWQAMPNSNQGQEIIERYKSRLAPSLTKYDIDKFFGLVEMAYERKALTEERKESYIEEGKEMFAKIELEEAGNYLLMRTYYGFGYRGGDGVLQYSYNPRKALCLEEKKELEEQGVLTTPLIMENYYFYHFDHNQIRRVKEQFALTIKEQLNQEYLKDVQLIRQIPGVMGQEEFENDLIKQRENLEPAAYQDLLNYGLRWNILTKKN